jgi:hypothetical protein
MTATPFMTDDPRCCGSGTCIIETSGRCWCGQQWDGQKMVSAPLVPVHAADGDLPLPKPRPARAEL